MHLPNQFLDVLCRRLENCKELGEKALAQAEPEDLYWQPDEEANSVAVLLQHLHGNMISRFTDFLATDGEKPWRQRDQEFETPARLSREQLLTLWDQGWDCVLQAVQSLTPEDLSRSVTIRGAEMSVIDALLRQLGHANYHVGQIVYLIRMRRGPRWQTLSIARGQSAAYKPDPRD